MKKYTIYALLFISIILTGCKQPRTNANPVLTITGGQVQGVETNTTGVLVYKGIPFAAPPVGNLRWKAPQPVANWQGIKIADTFGPAAPQEDVTYTDRENTPGVVDYTKEFFYDGDPQRSEDCLYLNIWTPAAGNPDAKLPVAMWIHGGGYTRGFGYENEIDGEVFARRDVILVTINYRLGLLGYLAHPLLTAENENHVSGNYAVLDQIAALDWIRDNIAQFGGDPDNVTLFGQSAGAVNVQNMVGSNLTKGKVSKAIIQSVGGFGSLGTPTMAEAQQQSKAAFDAAGITTLEEMRKLSFSDLRRIQADAEAKGTSLTLHPVVDGYVIPGDFATIVRTGQIAPIPYMIGGTKDDMYFAVMGQPYYDFSLELVKLGRDPAYIYEFRRELPGDNSGAFHSADLWYLFGTLGKSWRPMTEADFALSNQITDYWTNFIKTGNPNANGLPQWLPYTRENQFVMGLDI